MTTLADLYAPGCTALWPPRSAWPSKPTAPDRRPSCPGAVRRPSGRYLSARWRRRRVEGQSCPGGSLPFGASPRICRLWCAGVVMTLTTSGMGARIGLTSTAHTTTNTTTTAMRTRRHTISLRVSGLARCSYHAWVRAAARACSSSKVRRPRPSAMHQVSHGWRCRDGFDRCARPASHDYSQGRPPWADGATSWQELARTLLDATAPPFRWESRPRVGSRTTDVAGIVLAAGAPCDACAAPVNHPHRRVAA